MHRLFLQFIGNDWGWTMHRGHAWNFKLSPVAPPRIWLARRYADPPDAAGDKGRVVDILDMGIEYGFHAWVDIADIPDHATGEPAKEQHAKTPHICPNISISAIMPEIALDNLAWDMDHAFTVHAGTGPGGYLLNI